MSGVSGTFLALFPGDLIIYRAKLRGLSCNTGERTSGFTFSVPCITSNLSLALPYAPPFFLLPQPGPCCYFILGLLWTMQTSIGHPWPDRNGHRGRVVDLVEYERGNHGSP